MHWTILMMTLFLTVTIGMRPNTGCICIRNGRETQMPSFYCAFNQPRPGHLGFLSGLYYHCRPYQDECDYCSEGWRRTCTKQCHCNFDLSLQHLYTDEYSRMGDGRNRSVLTYNGMLPGPPIVVCEGDKVTIKLTNNLRNMQIDDSQTTLHLHGIPEKHRPWSDGVPGVNQCPMESGKTFTYGFDGSSGVAAGTYWYHSHVGKQREDGAYGALIVLDKLRKLPDVLHMPDMIDDPRNTLIMQEWYKNITTQIPRSILINGNGRVGDTMNGIPPGVDEAAHIRQYLEAKIETPFVQIPNPEFDPSSFKTNYAEFDIKNPGKDYRFRLIGAISQNFPLYITVENHTFTAIATDSLYIQPVTGLEALWISAGERYDIVIHTKRTYGDDPFKIKVYGNTAKGSHLCSIAWLKYPNQAVDYSYYVTHKECGDFGLKDSVKTLNPVPNSYTQFHDNNFVYIKDLRAANNKPLQYQNLRTHYIGFEDLRFNDFSMTYPNIPFLFQSYPDMSKRCYVNPYTHKSVQPGHCKPGKYCNCEHVILERWLPDGWMEVVLINPSKTAHPIHQHGGWYRVIGMGQYDKNNHTIGKINRAFIIEQDKKKLLHRNFLAPAWKDTIQVPTNGYVILRTPINQNMGTWIFHCHINFHVLAGMALVFQIGVGPSYNIGGGVGPWEPQKWTVGPYGGNINKACPEGNIVPIQWFYGRKGNSKCANPGDMVRFLWDHDHNVNKLTKTNWDNCKGFSNIQPGPGNYVWKAPNTLGIYYFACGVNNGGHCSTSGGNMKVAITVQKEPCPK